MKNGFLILKGKLSLLTPALIGSGKSDWTKMDVILDADGKPFIPATSLIGVLRHRIKLIDQDPEKFNAYWGFSDEENGRHSALCCSDLCCLSEDKDIKITTREGIAVDTATGLVKKGALYDYQVIEPGLEFSLNMEVLIKDGDDVEFFTRMTATIMDLLESGKIALGAKTNNGFGRIKLHAARLSHLRFDNPDHVKQWFRFGVEDKDMDLPSIRNVPVLPLQYKNNFVIEAKFKLKNSLIIRSYSDHPDDPDAVTIKSGNNAVIPGSSLRGALRARAERIVNTLNIPGGEDILKHLFGFADADSNTDSTEVSKEKSNEKIKGKLIVEETLLPAYPEELQPRIKIDRFTGGTIEGALFDSMPLFSEKETGNDSPEKLTRVTLRAGDCTDYEAGLLLLLLKDLWTGDLAVGGEKNVGRGVFQGVGANISIHGHPETLVIPPDPGELKDKHKKVLQDMVDKLVHFTPQEEANEH